ncbi:restriction endonuclease subunit S [Methanobrevibacter intestini]|uniref:restriction endonuclease subunit S n=1 Tax=Methanobrevibacter intestini TaxID=2911853 RepID=UPI003CEE571E
MSEEKLVPKLRFSGFTDEWNEVTLNDVATFSKGKGISKNDISNYGIECVRYGELYTKYNEMIYNIESKTDLDKNELKLSEKNDILIPCSGETAIDLATASCIQKDQVAIGGDITVIKTNQYAPFITYYLNQKKTEIAKYAQGVSIVHLYPKDFKVMNIRIPSINEQKMIIRLLEEITKKEQLLESKYQQYQEFKKYLMQQIFTQKLRFDDNCHYKTKKVKDFLTESKIEGTDDINKRLTVKLNLKGITVRESKTIEKEGATKQFIRKSGQFIYGKQNLHKGAFGIVPKELDGYLSSSDIPSFDFKGEIEPKWFYYYFSRKSFYESLESLSTGTGSKRISPKEFLNIKLIVPELKEQHRIVCLNFIHG